MNKITIKRNTTKTFPCTFTYSDGSPFDLTDCKIYFTVKSILDVGGETIIQKEIDGSEGGDIEYPTSGIFNIVLTKEDLDITPAVYFFEVILIDSSNNEINMGEGIIVVQERITEEINV